MTTQQTQISTSAEREPSVRILGSRVHLAPVTEAIAEDGYKEQL